MKVRVILAYGPYSVGHIIPNMPGNAARTLIARGLVEQVHDEKAMKSPVDRMMRGGIKKQSR